MSLAPCTTIGLTLHDHIGHLVLNQPPSNMMTLTFFREFRNIIQYLTGLKDLKALVISGKGRHFSSGAELSGLLDDIRLNTTTNAAGQLEQVPLSLMQNYETLVQLERFDIPVIAAIRGVCLGSALELALFCHFRFCGEDAVFGLPETSFNLVPGLGGIKKLSDLIGRGRTLELVLRGKTFSAAEALELKVVHKILPKRDLVETALAFAGSMGPDFRSEKARLYMKKYFA